LTENQLLTKQIKDEKTNFLLDYIEYNLVSPFSFFDWLGAVARWLAFEKTMSATPNVFRKRLARKLCK
jgi:hypothetical protein